MLKRLQSLLDHLQSWVDHELYPQIVGFMAFADMFVFFIPTDGLLITSVAAHPRRAIALTLWTSIGSTLGAVLLAELTSTHGMSLIETFFPTLPQHENWLWGQHLLETHGAWTLALIAALPLVPHPIILLAGLAKISLTKIFFAVLLGRILKYGTYSALASFAPHLLKRFTHVQKEIKEVDTDETTTQKPTEKPTETPTPKE